MLSMTVKGVLCGLALAGAGAVGLAWSHTADAAPAEHTMMQCVPFSGCVKGTSYCGPILICGGKIYTSLVIVIHP